MENSYSYLKDINFLKTLINSPVITYYIKIILLNWQQQSIEEIQGQIVNANINIDGRSAIRRTASITLLIQDLNIYKKISINKKVKIEIGYINNTKQYIDYPILWFPLGLYVITGCSSSFSSSGLTLSLQLKDKMCLLNGECGGTLDASVVFDTYETTDENGNFILERPTIYQIIQELVNHFGKEQLGKIIISDLDSRVKQVMKWTGSIPLYFLNKNGQYYMTLDETDAANKRHNGYIDILGSPFSYGEDVGFIYTDFTFPGDLIGDAGNTVVDILQKIKNVLGNYEYFYDLDGNFVFQQVKNYLNNSQSKYIIDSLNARKMPPDYISQTFSQEETYLINTSRGKSIFEFNDSNLIISYNNNPQYQMVKNDFTIWGIRKTIDNNEIPIRYHLAIDTKPKINNTYEAFEYIDNNDNIAKWHVPLKFNTKQNFPKIGTVGIYYLAQDTGKIYKWGVNNLTYDYIEINVTLENITTTDWRTELYFQGVAAEPYGLNSNFYYTELLNEWPVIYNIREGKFKEEFIKNPSGINYYLDFLDVDNHISEFKIENIGKRSKVINEGQNVNCVFEPYIPDIILINLSSTIDIEAQRRECEQRNQAYYQVSNQIYSNLSSGGSFNSGYNYIRQLIHEYTSFNENITLQTLPIYFLQPNTCISVRNEQSNIYGDYMIQNLSFSLDASSVLSISAKRALQKI